MLATAFGRALLPLQAKHVRQQLGDDRLATRVAAANQLSDTVSHAAAVLQALRPGPREAPLVRRIRTSLDAEAQGLVALARALRSRHAYDAGRRKALLADVRVRQSTRALSALGYRLRRATEAR